MTLSGMRFLFVACLGVSACHRANKPIEPKPIASNAAPPVEAIGSARPQDTKSAVCGDIRPDEPKQFVLSVSQALESDDTVAWNGMQSSRFQQTTRVDPGLAKMRFESWKNAFRDRTTELLAMTCRMEGRDTTIMCNTQKPLKFRIVREGCEMKIDDN